MCSFDVTVDANLSVGENAFSNSIKLFPNPTKDLITINSVTNISLDSITILDLNGRTLQTITNIGQLSDGKTIDISNLAAGMYFMKLQDSESRVAVKRIVKN